MADLCVRNALFLRLLLLCGLFGGIVVERERKANGPLRYSHVYDHQKREMPLFYRIHAHTHAQERDKEANKGEGEIKKNSGYIDGSEREREEKRDKENGRRMD